MTLGPRPEVSVVIPTRNRRDSLLRVLEALTHQTVGHDLFEVVVVCDGCTDGTAGACARLITPYRLTVIDESRAAGPAAARNKALAAAIGGVVIFLDDDVVPDPNLIAEHLRAHQQDQMAAVIGPLLAPSGFALNPWTRWEAAMLDGQYHDMAAGRWEPTPRQFYTGNASVRREHLIAAGGFNESFARAEDVELAYRLQRMHLRFYFSPSARGWHFARRSLTSWLGIARAYGEADVAMYQSGFRMTLQSMAKEYGWRRKSLRRLARLCVGRPALLTPTVAVAIGLARLVDAFQWRRGGQAAYSAIFNLCYWDAISGRLGGRSRFWELVRSHAPGAG